MMRAHQGISIRHDVCLTNAESLAKKLKVIFFFALLLCVRYIYSECKVKIFLPKINNIFQKN